MKRGIVVILFWLLLCTPASAQEIVGPARVIDGDTIEIAGTRIRLYGIDAPEWYQICFGPNAQPWRCGRDSAWALRDLTKGHAVRCPELFGLDRYRRTLAVCFVGSVEINRAMVESGMAWAYRKYSKRYVEIEERAKARKTGVWGGPIPNTTPEDVRKGR